MKQEKTCGNCDHLNITDMGGLGLAGCKKTGFVNKWGEDNDKTSS